MEFQGFRQESFDILINIAFNNNKAYFEEHRDQYEQFVHQPLIAFEAALAPVIQKIDPRLRTGRLAVSRIYRDTRFSKNKEPFRDHMWIGYRPVGVSNSEFCGFYFEITPVSFGCGMGMYGPMTAFMNQFRKKILVNPQRFLNLTEVNGLMSRFELGGENYAKRHFADEDDRLQPWLEKRYFYLTNSCGDLSLSMSGELVERIARDFLLLQPLYNFIHDL